MKPLALPALLSLSLSLFSFSHEGRTQTPPEDSFRISVAVELVELQASVRDRQGRFVPDLTAANFQVYEDGVRQAITVFGHEDIPVTVGLVVDHSGSMLPKLAHVVKAAQTFARSSNPKDQMFVVNFNEKVSLGLPATHPFTDLPAELEAAIGRTPAAGMTALYDAIAKALDQLRNGLHTRKALLVVSDGGDNSSLLRLPDILKKAEESNVVIYTIGLFEDADPDRNPAVLRRLARATGGEAYFPGRLEDVVSISEAIARGIRHQYTLAYVSSNPPKPGVFRAIRVTTSADGRGKLVVRTRAGYIK